MYYFYSSFRKSGGVCVRFVLYSLAPVHAFHCYTRFQSLKQTTFSWRQLGLTAHVLFEGTRGLVELSLESSGEAIAEGLGLTKALGLARSV